MLIELGIVIWMVPPCGVGDTVGDTVGLAVGKGVGMKEGWALLDGTKLGAALDTLGALLEEGAALLVGCSDGGFDGWTDGCELG